jgi:hypothetical protein
MILGMAFFLRKSRRKALIKSLTTLTMPRAQARAFAGYPDDLTRLDEFLSGIVARLSAHRERLQEAELRGNEDEKRTFKAFLDADILCLNAYTAEFSERGLPSQLLPETVRLVNAKVGPSEPTN